MKLTGVYALLPARLQDAACSLYGYQLMRRRYGSGYPALEQAVFERDLWDRERLQEFASRRLQATVLHAAASVPFYRRLFASLKLDPADIRTPADLAALPVIDKRTVKEHLDEFRSQSSAIADCTTARTSGTTGSGLVFPLTLEAEREQWAVCWRYRRRFGIDRRTWYAHFYGKQVVPPARTRPPFWRVNSAGRQILFSGYHMSDANLPRYVEELNRRRPPLIQGYPSLLALLAEFVARTGKLDYQPRVVMTAAETLLPHQKALIERAFGVPCRQYYGMTEGAANASECPSGSLHVDEDYACVEFLPLPGTGGFRVVGTAYTNAAFPLLRYEVGDVADLDEPAAPCPCGRAGRVIKSIDGRIEDYVITPGGRRIGRLDHIFKDMVNVRECQIRQREPGSVVFRVVPGLNYREEDGRRLYREARRRLGEEIRVEIEQVASLPRTARGKLRLVVSELPEGRIAREGVQ